MQGTLKDITPSKYELTDVRIKVQILYGDS